MPEPLTLTSEMAAVLVLLAFLVYLFVFEVVRVDVAALLVMVVLGVSGLVPATKLFDGFSSNAVIAIIAVMILGSGLDRTGVLGRLAGYILRVGGSTEARVMPIVSGTAGMLSSFVQNVGAAALFVPVVSRISTRTGIPLSRLLMPMGFCAILGGTLTMVGSSPLILLNDLIEIANESLPQGGGQMQRFSLFSVTPVGLGLLVAGIAYFRFAGRLVLPSARGPTPDPRKTARYFEKVYGIRGDIFEATVTLDSPMAGRTVGEIERDSALPFIVAVRSADQVRLAPPADEMIWVGTTVALMGVPEEVREFTRKQRLKLKKDLESFIDLLSPTRAGVSEAVVPPGSSVVGRSIGELRMRKRYGVSVLAVHRGERTLQDDLRGERLQAGDTLVLHSNWEDLQTLAEDREFVVVTDYPREQVRPHKVVHALFFFLLAIALVLFSDLRLSVALMAGAAGMIASGVLTVDEAYRAVSWQTVFLLAGLIPLGLAMESTGTAAWIAQEALVVVGDMPVWVVQAVFAVLATVFTLVLSNVAATVLLVPLAVNVGVGVGADPAVLALIVALATSNSFLIPTHQVNALVMGPAGYRVADFARAGGAMTVLFLVVLLVMVNLVF